MATETKSTTVRLKPIAQDGSSKPKIDSLALKKKIDGSSRPPTDSKMKSVTTVTKSEVKLKPAPLSSSKPTPSSSSKPTPSSSKPIASSSLKPTPSSSSKPTPSSSKPITSSSLKPTPSSSKTVTKKTTTTTKVREKKVYSLPGQKHDPPEQKEPLRIFYESLSKQIPTSEMAEFWLMEHGLLSPERAKRAFEKKQRKQKELRTGTPVKPSKPPPTKPETSRKPQPPPSRNGDIKAKKRIVDDSDDDDDFVLSHKRWKSS